MDTLGVGGIAVLSHNTLKTKFPTIFQDVKKQVRKTDQDKLEQQAKGKDDIEGYGSRYIKYLHQMRNEHDSQSYWFN